MMSNLWNKSWFESVFCKDGSNCNLCRRRHAGRKWRADTESKYAVPSVDFDCPYGRDWVEDKPAEKINYSDSPRTKYREAIAAVAALDQTDPTVIRINEKLDIAKRDIEANKHCYPCVEKVYKRFVKTSAAMIRLVAPKD